MSPRLSSIKWRYAFSALLLLAIAGLVRFRDTKMEPEAKTTFDSEKLPLQYATNSIPFNASDQMRRTFMPPSGSYHTLTPDKMADFVFVTAASSNHFAESVDAIASIQTLMPEKKILYFDIGLKADQIAQVKSWCSVTYRYFNMSRLPKFVSKNLFTCAWKPFVIEASSLIVILQAFLQIYLYLPRCRQCNTCR
ncbi:hypothetical protein LSAT2_031931 [Lamellibrachia satsuma]|nr:hypothetical protein LSAT2_031931 [Lamellibrachia satsuma]